MPHSSTTRRPEAMNRPCRLHPTSSPPPTLLPLGGAVCSRRRNGSRRIARSACGTRGGRVTLAAYAIPGVVGLRVAAGLPAQYGIYCYLVGGVAYALFGTFASACGRPHLGDFDARRHDGRRHGQWRSGAVG